MALHDAGDAVTLTAFGGRGFVFVGRSGDIEGTSNPLLVDVDADLEIIARFAQAQQPDDSTDADPPDEVADDLVNDHLGSEPEPAVRALACLWVLLSRGS